MFKRSIIIFTLLLCSCSDIIPTDTQPFRRYQIDGYTITTINNNTLEVGRDIFTNATPGIIYNILGLDKYYTTRNSYIVHKGGTVVLIDGGSSNLIGTHQGELIYNLEKAGYHTDDIHYILLHHLGVGIGGKDDVDLTQTFSNAKVYLSKSEYDFWITPDNTSRKIVPDNMSYNFERATLFASLYTDIETFEKDNSSTSRDNITINSDIVFKLLPMQGYTKGHYGYELVLDNKSIIFTGDMFFCLPVQFYMNLVNTIYDLYQPDSALNRAKILDNYTILKYYPKEPTFDDDGALVEDNNTTNHDYILAGLHMRFPSFYKLYKTKDGIKYIAINSIDFKDDLYNR